MPTVKVDTIWQISVETEENKTIIVNVPKVCICILLSSWDSEVDLVYMYMRILSLVVSLLPHNMKPSYPATIRVNRLNFSAA